MKRPKLDLPLRTVLLYLLFGGLWILLSDQMLFLLVPHNVIANTYQTLKGWFFIVFSGSLLYILLRTQHVRDRGIQQRAAWLASFPERNPNLVIEADFTGVVFYMNPAAQNKFPDLQALGFKHPWLAGLGPILVGFQKQEISEQQREIQIGDSWYLQSLYFIPETARLRIYGSDITARKQAEAQTLQMKRLYATLSQVNQTIVRVQDREELYQSICDVAVQFGEFQLAWIGLLEEATGEIRPIAATGLGINDRPFSVLNIHSGPLAEGMIAQAIRSSRVITGEDIQVDEGLRAFHEGCIQPGFHSAAVVPFQLEGKVVGTLNLLAKEKGLFRIMEELRLLEEMGLDISFALDMLKREEKRRQAEEELRENETIFSSFLEHSPVFIFFKDKDIRALRLSKNYERMLGMPLERALGKTMDELFPSDLAKSMVADDRRILNEGRQVDVVEELGGRIYETTKFPIMKDGEPTMLAGFTVDITERKRAEGALRASEERFRLLFENNHTVMMLIEPVSGAIRNANQAAAEFYGYPISDLCAMSINEINQLTPDEVYAERMRAIREERNYFNFHHRLSNGEIRSVEVHSAPVEIDGSTLLFSIVHDITERKRVEEERQARSRQLAALLDASQSLTESLNLSEVLQRIVDKAANVLKVDASAIYLVQGEHLYLGAASPPLPAELPQGLRRAKLADHPHLAKALSTGQTVVLEDSVSATLTAAEQVVCDALELRTVLYMPLTAGKDTTGILTLASVGQPRQFSRDEEDLALALANQASLALANARLYQDVSLHLKELENQIAERRQAQEQFHLVVESAPNAIMLVSSNGRLRLVNAQVEKYFGYDRTELIGMDIHELIPHRFREQHLVQLVGFLSTPHPKPMGIGRELCALRKDGSEFPAEIGLTPLDSSNESLVMVTIIDITARKQAEEQLKRHISYLTGLREVDQAIASSFDIRLSLNILTSRTVPLLKVDAAAILLLDPVMNTLEYAARYGFRRNILPTGSIRLGESYAGRVVMERRILRVPNLTNELHDGFHKGFLREENFVTYYGVPLIVKGKVVGVMEVFHRTPVNRDQEWFDFLNSLAGQAAIAIDNARLWEQVQRHARDLELRVAERTAALNRTNAELEHANRAKDEFLANMSHELRTPLNSILGLSESLLEQRRDSLTDYQQRSLQIIESSGHHLLELINDILDLSKIEAGKFDYYPQIVELDALCRSSLAFVKNQAVRKSITITYDNETSIANIAADPRRLKQVLVNLLTNAVKFTPEGGQVMLEVHVDEGQDLVEFSVADNGIGIAPQDLKHLFQPFVQVDSKLNRQFEGTGLGLALVHKLTDMHGGSVNVESHIGAGSRFTVRLPWGQQLIAQQTTGRLVHEVLADRPEKSNVPSDGRLVLLAEDNPASILTIGEYLKSHGYRFVEAHDGLEAIEKAEANDPSIILMDIQMPVLDGLEAIRRLRTNPRFAAIPVISLTALAMPGDRERCLEAGANEYMTKPVRLKFLKQTIENLLQG